MNYLLNILKEKFMTNKTNNTVNNQPLEDLLKETPETLAENIGQELKDGTAKQFRIVDLWKIEKTQRSSHIQNKWLN
jgi:hypothetical protein